MDRTKTKLVFEWAYAASYRHMSDSPFGYVRLVGKRDCREGDWIV